MAHELTYPEALETLLTRLPELELVLGPQAKPGLESIHRLLQEAVAARADVIVSGDSDLLALESYEGIPIITAAQLMARIAAELANRAEHV